MTNNGLDPKNQEKQAKLLWLVAELTYRCPLQCPYCSNPLDFASYKNELTTDEWIRVFEQARALGAVQLGLTGGEPLIRQDLEELIQAAHELGFYTNLITSAVGMDEERLTRFKQAGLDNIQISFQASKQTVNDFIAGTHAFEHKIAMAKCVKKLGFPLIFNIVLHQQNIDEIESILEMAISLDADQVELANTQYYGYALENRDLLMPTKQQLDHAEKIAKQYQQRYGEKHKIFYVIPDYYATRPKPCMNGWASTSLNIAPDGTALPCHAARIIKEIDFPNVRDHDIETIWQDSDAFNQFRGYSWMKQPCKTCPERFKDFGGCRCQAYLLTGDAAKADPVCDLSPDHHLITEAVEKAQKSQPTEHTLVFRNSKFSKKIAKLLNSNKNEA